VERFCGGLWSRDGAPPLIRERSGVGTEREGRIPRSRSACTETLLARVPPFLLTGGSNTMDLDESLVRLILLVVPRWWMLLLVGDVVLVDDDDDAAAAGFVDSLVCTGFLVILVDATSGGELLVKLVVRLVGATGNGDVTLTGTTLVASLVAGLVVAFFLLGLVDDDAAEFFGSLVGCFVGSLGGSLVGGGGFLSRFDDVDSFL